MDWNARHQRSPLGVPTRPNWWSDPSQGLCCLQTPLEQEVQAEDWMRLKSAFQVSQHLANQNSQTCKYLVRWFNENDLLHNVNCVIWPFCSSWSGIFCSTTMYCLARPAVTKAFARAASRSLPIAGSASLHTLPDLPYAYDVRYVANLIVGPQVLTRIRHWSPISHKRSWNFITPNTITPMSKVLTLLKKNTPRPQTWNRGLFCKLLSSLTEEVRHLWDHFSSFHHLDDHLLRPHQPFPFLEEPCAWRPQQ